MARIVKMTADRFAAMNQIDIEAWSDWATKKFGRAIQFPSKLPVYGTYLDGDPDGGNGFSFDEYSAAALIAAVRRALRHYDDEKKWMRWVRRAMRQDFSWKRSASEYVDVYQKAMT